MSMFSCAGAMAAAGEIKSFIEEKKLENKDKPDVVKALDEVYAKAQAIWSSAESGWY